MCEELAHSILKVSILCPGPVLTNPEINTHGNRAKLVMLMPYELAKTGIKKLSKGQGVMVPGKINWTIARFLKLFPQACGMKILERLFRVYKDH